MTPSYLMTALTRIADLDRVPFTVAPCRRSKWRDGDYVAATVTGEPNQLYHFEVSSGRRVDVMADDQIISALGTRAATLEGVGSWRDVAADGAMHSLTGAGLLGKATSVSRLMPRFMSLDYIGHVMRDGRRLGMKDFVLAQTAVRLEVPVILLIGTSMSAGKTSTGRLIVHELKRAGLKVAGAKFTGAARYHDVLSFADAGADHILDFVDAGLPSTVVKPDVFRAAMENMLAQLAAFDIDILVAEAGASPLEPYNGQIAVQMLMPNLRFTVLCASDPYAVVGVTKAFGLMPDLVAGPAAATESAVKLVKTLTGLPGLDNLDTRAGEKLRQYLRDAIPELLNRGQSDSRG